MPVLAMVVTFFYVSFFDRTGVILAVVMGVLIFIVGLIVTRLIDIQTVKVTKYIVRRLADHKKMKDFIMNHLQEKWGVFLTDRGDFLSVAVEYHLTSPVF